MSERATFASRLGTLWSMVGVAVGLGNVWRFPCGAFSLQIVLTGVVLAIEGAVPVRGLREGIEHA